MLLFLLVVVSQVMWPQSQYLELIEASLSHRLWLVWHLSITILHHCRSRHHFLPDSYCLWMCLLYSTKIKYKIRCPPSGQG